MKKNILLTVILALCASFAALAGPAFPGKITYTQPDGSTIDIWLHGDEYGHWATDASGNILKQDEQGYWRIATTSLEDLGKRASARREEANILRRKAAASKSSNFGSPRIPVLLIGFKDKEFITTNEQFDAMLNMPGYSDNNAVGSVWDFYNDNSMGAFTPTFEVLGPVNVPFNESYYGANSGDNDVLPEMALVHAARKLDGEVDFSRYDNDGDGIVDFVLYYFAGYDEAQGGASTCIWSHAWNLSASSSARDSCTFDGVKIDSYFCTSELKNGSGSTMCSIGTTCHEFAHTLGLPDFYDTNYSSNGYAANMYGFDLMADGAYNKNSTTPPYFTAEELMEIGWLPEIPELMSDGSYSLDAVNFPNATKYSAFMTKTSTPNEYFVYEVRGGKGWDAGIGYSGLLVYHVDKSTNKVYSSYTAEELWYYNALNAFSSHPCCYVVPAAKPEQTSVYSGSKYLFGSGSYTSFNPKAWDGSYTNFKFSNISYSSGTATFNFVNENPKGIRGTVRNADGNPISGVTVTAVAGEGVSNAPGSGKALSIRNIVRKLFNPAGKHLRASGAQSWSVTTAADGTFFLEGLPSGPFQVTATKTGYTPATVAAEVSSMVTTQDITLLRKGQDGPATIYAWPNDQLTDEDEDIVGSDSRSMTAQNLYPASEMSRYAGKQIKELTFFIYGSGYTTYRDVNVIIDYGDERVATVPVSSVNQGGYTTVNLKDLGLIIPEGRDIYAGVGFSRGGYYQGGYYYAFGAFYKSDDYGNTYSWAKAWPYDGLVSSFSTTSTGTRESWDVIFDFTITLCDYEAPDLGFNYISDPGNGSYRSGDVFDFILIETAGARRPGSVIEWFYDGEAVADDSVTLTAGKHTVAARFTTTAGNTKIVELDLSVN